MFIYNNFSRDGFMIEEYAKNIERLYVFYTIKYKFYSVEYGKTTSKNRLQLN